MPQRLGLRKFDLADKALVEKLLKLMQAHEVDFHSTFRALSFFRPGGAGDATEPIVSNAAFIEKLNESVVDHKKGAAAAAWKVWLGDYAARILQDESEWATEQADWLQTRECAMKLANPRFVLRQWVLEEVIATCEEGDTTQSRDILAKMLEVSIPLIERTHLSCVDCRCRRILSNDGEVKGRMFVISLKRKSRNAVIARSVQGKCLAFSVAAHPRVWELFTQ